jgi:hypothetical protein
MKPKTINGSLLNGIMLASLLNSYVKAINEGAVPNIENAWSYICKNECQKFVFEAIELYTTTLKNLT